VIAQSADSHFLIRVAWNVISDFRAWITDNSTALSAMMSPFTKLGEFIFADFTI
jgi:hypothetical protein